MSDLARDPVFGEVARALSPRLWVGGVSFRADTIPERELAIFDKYGLPFELSVGETPWPEQCLSLVFDREDLERAAMSSPCAAAMLAAHDNAEAEPRRLRILGVVNVTPDSFSDGGRFLDPARAVEHGLELVAQGADGLDVGGESTRPGSESITLEEELERVIPVIRGLALATKVPISIDTQKSAVARAALDAGAVIVNDVSAGTADAQMFAVVAERGAYYVAMHMQGDPRTMQDAPSYVDVAAEVLEYLRERCFRALEAGVRRERLWIDPGIGFGKTLADNTHLMRHLSQLRSLGLPIVLGVSRKSFITKITGLDTPPEQRIGGTAAAVAIGVLGGADVLRVHDVAIMREAALVARALGRPY